MQWNDVSIFNMIYLDYLEWRYKIPYCDMNEELNSNGIEWLSFKL